MAMARVCSPWALQWMAIGGEGRCGSGSAWGFHSREEELQWCSVQRARSTMVARPSLQMVAAPVLLLLCSAATKTTLLLLLLLHPFSSSSLSLFPHFYFLSSSLFFFFSSLFLSGYGQWGRMGRLARCEVSEGCAERVLGVLL